MFKTVDSTHNINRLELKWNKIFFQCYQLYMGYSCSDKLKCMLWKKVFGRLLGISTTLWHSMHWDRAAGIFHGAWVQWKGIQRTRISESKLNGNSLVGNSYCTFNGYCHWKPVKCSLILLYIFLFTFSGVIHNISISWVSHNVLMMCANVSDSAAFMGNELSHWTIMLDQLKNTMQWLL